MPKLARYFVMIVILFATVFIQSTHVAEAGRWAIADNGVIRFTVLQVCRDGARILAANTTPNPPSSAQSQIRISAYLGDPNLTTDYGDGPYQGPLLLPTTIVTATYQAVPLPPDPPVTPNPTHVYAETSVYWARQLDPGTLVAFAIDNNSRLRELVQSCFLNLPTAAWNQSVTFTRAMLGTPYNILPTSEIYYRLDSLPGAGTLLKGGQPLLPGATFTQADIDAGQVVYRHNGSRRSADSFSYTMRGITRVSISSAHQQSNSPSSEPSLAPFAPNRIAFSSSASNLVANDVNLSQDVFLRDLVTGSTTLLSERVDGTRPAGAAARPAIDASGWNVTFDSIAGLTLDGAACELKPDSNSQRDVYQWHAPTAGPTTPQLQRLSTFQSGMACVEATTDSWLGMGRYFLSLDPVFVGGSTASWQLVAKNSPSEVTRLTVMNGNSAVRGNGHTVSVSSAGDGLVLFESSAIAVKICYLNEASEVARPSFLQ